MVADPDVPLLNRTVQANLPPGSTYKPILVAAALAEEVRNPAQKTDCIGVFYLGNRPFDCWKPEGHGMVDMRDALAVSCNVFFYGLGLEVGVDRWARYGRLFGFGSPVALDMNETSPGLLPDRRFLDRRYGKNGWSKGMMANLSVGQGDLLVTPIQMVQMAVGIANKGNLPRFHVVRAIEDPVTKTVKTTPVQTETIPIPADVFEFLRDAMDQAVNRPDGTGAAARQVRAVVCGKTGTAQNPRGEPHAWFIGFAPRNDPAIALVVVLENAGTGGGQAAPIAGQIFRRFFSQEAWR
jgi:penicillin-binding protein 2